MWNLLLLLQENFSIGSDLEDFERDRKCQTTYLFNGKNQTLLIKMNTMYSFSGLKNKNKDSLAQKITLDHVYWIFAKCKIAIALTSHYDKNAKNLISNIFELQKLMIIKNQIFKKNSFHSHSKGRIICNFNSTDSQNIQKDQNSAYLCHRI